MAIGIKRESFNLFPLILCNQCAIEIIQLLHREREAEKKCNFEEMTKPSFMGKKGESSMTRAKRAKDDRKVDKRDIAVDKSQLIS